MQSEHLFLLTGDIKIDALTQKAYHNKTEIKLSDLSFRTLLVLVKSFPQPQSNDELIEKVWNQTAVSPETVTQRIALIRKALNEAGVDAKHYLAATRHVGYRWLKPVKQTDSNNSHHFKIFLLVLIFGSMLVIGSWQLWQKYKPQLPQTDTSAVVSAQDLIGQAWNYLEKHNAQSNQLAVGLFKQALAVNPSDVDALTGLSIALSHEVTKFNQDAERLQEAKAAAQKAVELDPEHAQAWAALAFVDDASGEIDDAISGYEKAIKLAPNNAATISSLAYLYSVKGHLVEALRLNISVLGSKQIYLDLQIAQVLNLMGFDLLAEQWFYKADVLSPDNVFATHQRARFYLSNNQLPKAREIIVQAQKRGIVRPELPSLLGLLAWKNGDMNSAFHHFSTALEIDNTDIQSFLLMKSLSSNQEQLETQKHEWLLTTVSWPSQSIYQAQFYAHAGQVDAAFDALFRAFDEGYRDFRWLQWLPTLSKIKQDARWYSLITNMQNDVDKQRQLLLTADWLPTSFLDPKN